MRLLCLAIELGAEPSGGARSGRADSPSAATESPLLRLHAGIAAGRLSSYLLGSLADGLEYLVAGPLVEQMGRAAERATAGQLVLSSSAAAALALHAGRTRELLPPPFDQPTLVVVPGAQPVGRLERKRRRHRGSRLARGIAAPGVQREDDDTRRRREQRRPRRGAAGGALMEDGRGVPELPSTGADSQQLSRLRGQAAEPSAARRRGTASALGWATAPLRRR